MSYQRLHRTEIYLGSQQHFKSSYLLCQTSSGLTNFPMTTTTSFFSSLISHQFPLFFPQMLIHSSSLWRTLWQGTKTISLTVIHYDDVLYNEIWTLLISAQNASSWINCSFLWDFLVFLFLRKEMMGGSQSGVSRVLLWESLGFLKTIGLLLFFFLGILCTKKACSNHVPSVTFHHLSL